MEHNELESITGFLKKTFNFSKHLKVHSEIEAGYAHAFFVGISSRLNLDAASIIFIAWAIRNWDLN